MKSDQEEMRDSLEEMKNNQEINKALEDQEHNKQTKRLGDDKQGSNVENCFENEVW